MGVKVNESGTIKNLALDRDEVETLRVNIKIPAITHTSKTATIKPSDLGITQGFNMGYAASTDSEGVTSYWPYEISSSYAGAKQWDEIPSECKVLLRTGQFNFSLNCPCKFKAYTSTITSQLDNPTHFPRGDTKFLKGGISAFTTAQNAAKTVSSTVKWTYTAYIVFVLTILDERNYKIETALIYSSFGISASSALTATYGVDIASRSIFPYTRYLINGDYLIEKSPYSEKSFTPDPVYTK